MSDNAMAASQPRVPPPLGSDASIPNAFAVGWYLADLYAMALPAEQGRPDDIPAACPVVPQTTDANGNGLLHVLGPSGQWELLVDRLLAKVNQLAGSFADASVLSALSGRLETVATRGPELVALFEQPVGAARVRAIHEDLQQALSATHVRLGKAYQLGQGLADTRRLAPNADKSTLARCFGARLTSIQTWLADLASNLPEHASRSVALSLTAWQQWAENPRFVSRRRWGHKSKRDVVFPSTAVWMALRRQGELWRSLLMGEKLGKDMLEPTNYAKAARTLFRRMLKSRPWVLALFVLFAAGLAAGVYFVMTAQSTVKAISGAALSVLGAFGISAASLKATAADVGKDLAMHVWGAELDLAIAEAITIAPGGWSVKWKRVLIAPRGQDPHVARNADRLTGLFSDLGARTRARTKVLRYLHTDCRLVENNSQRARGNENVATWLLARAEMLHQPDDPVPGIAGRLLSGHRNGNPGGTFFVWTFADGMVSEVGVHTDYSTALEAAGLLHAD